MNQTSGSTIVAGADGCRNGWVVVKASAKHAGLSIFDICVVPNFSALLEITSDCAAVAVDVPIGLADDGNRLADFAARKQLGPYRGSSVFPCPARPLLNTTSYTEANALSRAVLGKGFSAQAFGILPKIREVDLCMTPAMQKRIVESHPEVCFWALAGDEPLVSSKRSSDGRAERVSLLETLFGPAIREILPPRGSRWDDLYDACVLVWTASHVAAGTAVHLPSEPQRDSRGLRMEMVY